MWLPPLKLVGGGTDFDKVESANEGNKTGNNSTSKDELLRKDLSFLNLRSWDVAHATCLLLQAAMGWAATNLAGLVIGGWQANWTNPMGNTVVAKWFRNLNCNISTS